MPQASHLDRGPGAIERYLEREKQRQEKRSRRGSSRFKLAPGETKTITLIDVPNIFFGEHSGKKGNEFWSKVCLGDISKAKNAERPVCPYCSEGVKLADMLLVGTVINHTGFEADDGKVIKHFKQLWVVKWTGLRSWLHELQKLPEEARNKNPFAWTMWEVRRDDDEKSVGCGQYFSLKFDFKGKERFISALKKKGIEKEDWTGFVAPINYDEVLKTETEDEARKFLGLGPVPGSPQDVPREEEVPFEMADEDLDKDVDPDAEKDIEDVLDEI